MKNNGVLLAGILAVCTGAGGFFAGKGASGSADAKDDEAKSAKSVGESSSRGSKGALTTREGNEPNMRGFELSQNPEAGLQILIEELRQSPMAQMDFEALFGIWDMVQYLDGYELAALMDELDEMGGGQEMMAVRMMLLNRWAAKDGPAAMESLLEGEKGMMQSIGAMGAMMGWMRTDPDQAYAWFQENGDQLSLGGMGMGKEQFEGMYFASLAKKDFEGTMAKLDDMDKKVQAAVIQQLSQGASMDEGQRDQLLTYLRGKEDSKLLSDARQSIVSQMAWHDPKGAIEFIDEENLDSDERKTLVSSATSMWSHSDPAGAVEFMGEELKGDENAGDRISNAFGNWIAQDEAAAAEWLTGQPDEFKTDSVFRDAGQRLLNDGSYERSAEWYGQILDDGQRTANYLSLYGTWQGEDAAAAEQWKNSLPASDQAHFDPREAAVGAEVGAIIGGSVGGEVEGMVEGAVEE